ncbi:hypothetical protein MAR_029406 [Mya arenaria]|uniref:RRM domain-containing protein n=1 Tax=Mya arenaria TaxID=6604 RepID=A0ABY7DIB9_MYAAR|nr:hypothetical protein MAR_029406 [Mya arenaria]
MLSHPGTKCSYKPLPRITKITFTVGPIRQEDLSTPELNKLMAMAQRFEITFDTIPVLDSNQTDKLGYITLPFEIRTQDYLLVIFDRLHNLKLGRGDREVSVKFPDELRRHVDEEKLKRSLFATFVDKDTGRDSLVEKFPEAKDITVRQHNFQWFGCMEFENADEALAVLKKGNQIEIEGQKVKIVRQPPDFEEMQKKQREQQQQYQQKGHRDKPRPMSSPGGMRGGGGRGGGPRPLLSNMGGGGGYNQRGGFSGRSGFGIGSGMGAGVTAFNQGYGGGYNQGGGNYQLGSKRKTDMGDFGGSTKRPYDNKRGGYGGGGGGGRGGRGGWGGGNSRCGLL